MTVSYLVLVSTGSRNFRSSSPSLQGGVADQNCPLLAVASLMACAATHLGTIGVDGPKVTSNLQQCAIS